MTLSTLSSFSELFLVNASLIQDEDHNCTQHSRCGQIPDFCSEIVEFSVLSRILFLVVPNIQFRAFQLSLGIELMFL